MKVSRLIVFDVPDRLGGLMERLRFRPTIKNPSHWYRLFNPALPGVHQEARRVLAHLNTAGLDRRKWAMVGHELSSQVMEIWQPENQGFGGALNATPITGRWRVKIKRK